MPRKPKLRKIKTLVTVDRVTIPVTLYPPKGPRTAWYAYWPGLVAARSTGQSSPDTAIQAVVCMLGNDGQLGHAEDLVLSDDEFEEIQRRHFAKKKDPAAAQRAQKSLKSCLEAISAFGAITGVRPVSLATPDDCERFQAQAQQRPWNWRKKYPKGKEAARRGEDRNERVARDARVSRAVMMEHYVDETDEELRQASNRTFYRLIAGMAPEVAERHGYQEAREVIELEEQLGRAVAAKDWQRANKITKRLAKRRG